MKKEREVKLLPFQGKIREFVKVQGWSTITVWACRFSGGAELLISDYYPTKHGAFFFGRKNARHCIAVDGGTYRQVLKRIETAVNSIVKAVS